MNMMNMKNAKFQTIRADFFLFISNLTREEASQKMFKDAFKFRLFSNLHFVMNIPVVIFEDEAGNKFVRAGAEAVKMGKIRQFFNRIEFSSIPIGEVRSLYRIRNIPVRSKEFLEKTKNTEMEIFSIFANKKNFHRTVFGVQGDKGIEMVFLTKKQALQYADGKKLVPLELHEEIFGEVSSHMTLNDLFHFSKMEMILNLKKRRIDLDRYSLFNLTKRRIRHEVIWREDQMTESCPSGSCSSESCSSSPSTAGYTMTFR